MGDNTILKELQMKVDWILEKMEAMEVGKAIADLYNEQMKGNHGSKIDRIEAVIEKLLSTNCSSFGSPHGQNSNTNNPRPSFQVRNIKLKFPRFDVKDVLDWIFKDEQFFEYYGTYDGDRLTIVAVHLDNDVVPWFQMMQRNQPFLYHGKVLPQP